MIKQKLCFLFKNVWYFYDTMYIYQYVLDSYVWWL